MSYTNSLWQRYSNVLCGISLVYENILCVCDAREKAAAPVCAKPFRVGEECGTSAKKESEERTGRAHKFVLLNYLKVMNPTNPLHLFFFTTYVVSLKEWSKSDDDANLLFIIIYYIFLETIICTEQFLVLRASSECSIMENTAATVWLTYCTASLHHYTPDTWIGS